MRQAGLGGDRKRYDLPMEKRRIAQKYQDLKAHGRFSVLLLLRESKTFARTAHIPEVDKQQRMICFTQDVI